MANVAAGARPIKFACLVAEVWLVPFSRPRPSSRSDGVVAATFSRDCALHRGDRSSFSTSACSSSAAQPSSGLGEVLPPELTAAGSGWSPQRRRRTIGCVHGSRRPRSTRGQAHSQGLAFQLWNAHRAPTPPPALPITALRQQFPAVSTGICSRWNRASRSRQAPNVGRRMTKLLYAEYPIAFTQTAQPLRPAFPGSWRSPHEPVVFAICLSHVKRQCVPHEPGTACPQQCRAAWAGLSAVCTSTNHTL